MEDERVASYFTNIPTIKELTAKDFDPISTWKLKSKKCTAILFYAPWCPHCKAVKDAWIKFSKMAAFMDVAAFNCEKNSAYLMKIKEDMPNLVTGFPTIIYYVNGSPDEFFQGERTHTNLLKRGMAICQNNKGA